MWKVTLCHMRICTGLFTFFSLVFFIWLSYWHFWPPGIPQTSYPHTSYSSDRCLSELMATFGIASTVPNVSQTTYVRLAKPSPIGLACQADVVLQKSINLRKTVNFTEPKILDSDQQARIHTIVYQLLQNFTQRKLEMFICGGTLLGSVRHFGLLPWDLDADVMIPTRQKAQARQLLIDVSAADEFRFVDTERTNQHWQLGIFCQPQNDKPPTRMYGTNRLYPVKSCKTLVDFFFGQVKLGYYTRLEYPYKFPASDIYPLRLRPYGPYLLPAPRHADKFLPAVYGSDYESRCKFKYVKKMGEFWCADLRPYYPFVTHLKFLYNGSRQLYVDVLVDKSNLLALYV